MDRKFEKTAKAEDYVSPSLDAAFVKVEKGFCESGNSYHEGFEPGNDLNFDWN